MRHASLVAQTYSGSIALIPFNKPKLSGRERDYLNEVLECGALSGDRTFSKRCQKFMEKRFAAHRVLLTTSCTSALEIAALLLDAEPGDEVILPSYTFVSTANAFLRAGVTLRFVDIEPQTLNMDPARVAETVTDLTKAIVPVHYAGVGCDMDAIASIAERHGIAVIEDAAHGVDATYKDRYLGTIGDLGTYSFHETKNFVCGEGGALVINRPDMVERAEIIREKGTNRNSFFRGEVDKYTWVDVGSSYLLSDLLAAVLLAQLESCEAITASRAAAYETYHRELEPLEEKGLLRRPVLPTERRTNYHMYYLLLDNQDTRDRLIKHLKDRGIMAVFHYVPLHTSPMGLRLGFKAGMLPVTENIAPRLLRLPMYAGLTPDQCRMISGEISSFFAA